MKQDGILGENYWLWLSGGVGGGDAPDHSANDLWDSKPNKLAEYRLYGDLARATRAERVARDAERARERVNIVPPVDTS